MENASKALLIAGGMLIALLIIGALLLMINQLGFFEKDIDKNKIAQLTEFNQDFVRYSDSKKILGVDIISLANKVEDYNNKKGTYKSINYEIKMTLNIDLASFNTKYGTHLFGNTTKYTITETDTMFISVIKKFTEYEKKYGLSTMAKLSSNYDNIASGSTTASQVAGKNISVTAEEIETYREYSEFKSSTFKSSQEPKYQNGQVTELSFIFVK